MAAYTKGSHIEIPHTAFHSFTTYSTNLLTRTCWYTRRYTGMGDNRRTTPAAKESNQSFITSWAKKIHIAVVSQVNNVYIPVWSASGACFSRIHCILNSQTILLIYIYIVKFCFISIRPCSAFTFYCSCFSPSHFIFMAVAFYPVISPPISYPSPLDCLLTWASAERTSALTLKTLTWNASPWRSRRRSE